MAVYECPECGNKVSDQARTCPHCGIDIYTCYECGGVVKYGVDSCPHCGARFEWNADEVNDENCDNSEESGELDTAAKFTSVVMALIPVGVVVIGQYFWKNDPDLVWIEGICVGLSSLWIYVYLFGNEKAAVECRKFYLGKTIAIFVAFIMFLACYDFCSRNLGSGSNANTSEQQVVNENVTKQGDELKINKEKHFKIKITNEIYVIAKSMEFTLWPDGSGKAHFDAIRELSPAMSRCTWRKSGVENPMSEGGDGTPVDAIAISCGDQNFVLAEDKTVYWVVNAAGEMGKIGTWTSK